MKKEGFKRIEEAQHLLEEIDGTFTKEGYEEYGRRRRL